MRFPWQRQTVSFDETREPLKEIVQEAVREALTADVGARIGLAEPSRLTYPMSDAASQAAMKRYDVANRSRKIVLYQTFLGESWISACVEAIAARLISGGWALDPIDPLHANETSRQPLMEYLNWCNPDESFSQIIHESATDLLWAGECYLEVTWKTSPTLHRDVPYELYTVDVISMDYVLDPATKRFISGYQQTTDTGERIDLTTEQIIRIWFPDPRNKLRALSPIEKLMNPTTWDTYLQLSEQKYFEQGNRGDLAITLKSGDENLASRTLKMIREKFLGVKNAHLPLVTFGDATIQNVGNRASLDILSRRKFAREEILAVYKVPPHMVSVVDHGGLGQGTLSDTMEKQFIHTAVDPIKQRMFEQLNFKLVVQGFGINDWVVSTSYADFRDTKEITDIQVNRIKAGISTINEERAELKRDPVKGGDEAVLVLAREVVPVKDLDKMHSQERLQTAAPLVGADTPEDAAKAGTLSAPGMPVSPSALSAAGKPAPSTREPASADKSPDAEAQRRELDLWEKTAAKRAREGKAQKPWQGVALEPARVEHLNRQLATAKTVEQVREAFSHESDVPQWLKDHVEKARVEIDAWNVDFAEKVLRELRHELANAGAS